VFFTGAGVASGLRVLTKPSFGSERRGAVVHTDTLIQTGGGRKTRSFSNQQDLVCLYDDTILTSPSHAPVRNLKPGGVLLVNTNRYSPERIRELLNLSPSACSVFTVPASQIARDLQLGSFFNMVMLGAMHRVCPHLDLEASLAFYEKNVPKPRDVNLEAIRRGFRETSDREIESSVPSQPDERAEEFFRWRPEEESLEEEFFRSLELSSGS
jgi:Pyruvate/2-oxoacid:ferredoxin oxidoreductase gamma subunit